MTYGVISDIHCHAWNTMSGVNEEGVNTRLAATLAELERVADKVVAAGGKVLVLDGDLFHSRGSLDPEVFNLVHDTFVRILAKHKELEIVGIPGNHDLKSDDTKELSSAFKSFTAIDPGRIKFFYKADTWAYDDEISLAFVPWRHRHEDLIADIETLVDRIGEDQVGSYDLHLHVGIDGTLSTMPDHGMTADRLHSFGFRNVFSGHYHHFKDFGNVYSVGALTHQTWGDIGTRAGFLIVEEGHVEHRASHAPSFVDVTGLDVSDMELECDGNFVRYRGDDMKESEIKGLREQFRKWGAVGVHMVVTREKPSARGTSVKTSAKSLNQSVESYVNHAFKERAPEHLEKIRVRAGAVLKDVQSLSSAA